MVGTGRSLGIVVVVFVFKHVSVRQMARVQSPIETSKIWDS